MPCRAPTPACGHRAAPPGAIRIFAWLLTPAVGTARISTRLGTLGEVSYAVAPKVVDAVLNVAYRVFPDSKAAGGDDQVSLSRGAKALVRLLPGVHW